MIRPGDPGETAGAWEVAMNRTDGPTAIVLSRQGVPVPETPTDPAMVARGGYVARPGDDAVLVATGSELGTGLAAAAILADRGISLRVVSMPCVEAFRAQDDEYRGDVLGEGVHRISLEAAATFGWGDIVGETALKIGVDQFGASAPAEALAELFGLTPDAVADRIAAFLT